MLSAKFPTNGMIWQSKPEIFSGENTDFDFSPEQFIVIGDTPNDILCARHFGAKCIAVFTGRNQTREILENEKPDIVIDDLTETKKLLDIFSRL